jgi:hypothetical protein
MKFIFALIVTLPFIGGPPQSFQNISQALKAGDATELGRFFDKQVEIAISSEEDIFNKEEAIKRVKAFFISHPPRSFNQVHQGTSRGNESHYYIGNLQTEKGAFRVYIYTRITNHEHVIKELRFDND